MPVSHTIAGMLQHQEVRIKTSQPNSSANQPLLSLMISITACMIIDYA